MCQCEYMVTVDCVLRNVEVSSEFARYFIKSVFLLQFWGAHRLAPAETTTDRGDTFTQVFTRPEAHPVHSPAALNIDRGEILLHSWYVVR